MSNDVFLGAYAVIYTRKVKSEIKTNVCPECNEDRYDYAAYCYKCGTKLIVSTMETLCHPDIFDVLGDGFGKEVFVAQYDEHGVIVIGSHRNNTKKCVISPININKYEIETRDRDLHQFHSNHRELLDSLLDNPLVTSILIEWGVFVRNYY